MKKIKSHTSIWSVEKVLYGINDLHLPFPITYSEMAWFVCTFLIVIMFADAPPLSFIENPLLKYVAIPAGLTWFVSRKSFDGKKPYGFLRSLISYAVRPKTTFGGKAVNYKKEKGDYNITIVRSERVGKEQISS